MEIGEGHVVQHGVVGHVRQVGTRTGHHLVHFRVLYLCRRDVTIA